MNNRGRNQLPDDKSIFSLETDFDAEEDSLLPVSSPASPRINHRSTPKDPKSFENQPISSSAQITNNNNRSNNTSNNSKRPLFSTSSLNSNSPNQPLLKDLIRNSPPIFASKKLDDDPFTIEMQSNYEDKVQYANRSGQGRPKQSFIDRLLGRPLPPGARTFNIGT